MKKYTLILLLLLLSEISFSQIRITNPKYDFGNIFEENGLVFAEFTLTNPYPSDTIVIKSVETSCGCTAILSKDTIIFPRSIVKLKISYNPDGRVGLFQKSIKVKTITGKNEQNELYLQIVGNVVPKVKIKHSNPELIEYKVAPIYFYPITQYDTSYLDFNFIVDFVNDLTYEIDYYQFSKVGFNVKVRDESKIEALEYLIRFSKYKFLREMKDRGYQVSQLFFAEPIFEKDSTIPPWSLAQIKAYSVNFNQDELTESEVKLTQFNLVKKEELMVDLHSDLPFDMDSIYAQINFKELNKKLLQDSILVLQADYKTPEKYETKHHLKFKAEIYKMVYKSLKKSSGISKSELIINFDSINTHSSTQFYFKLWQNQDLITPINISYQVKENEILSPLLPTYKQTIDENGELIIDVSSNDFKQFWNCLVASPKASSFITIILESSISHIHKNTNAELLEYADVRAKRIKKFIQTKFHQKTGHFITVNIKNVVSGPPFTSKNEFQKSNYLQFDYIKLIPIYKNERKSPIKAISARPYVVNYDYYFIGVDTTSFVFKKFANYLIYEIQKYGYVELKTESSASNIPVDRKKSNIYLAYKHLEESKKRLHKYLQNRLIDPNRVLISEERILVQGIPFSKNTPIVRYKKYQYVTFVPVKFISNR